MQHIWYIARNEVLSQPNRGFTPAEVEFLSAYFALSNLGLEGKPPEVVGDNFAMHTSHGDKTFSLLDLRDAGRNVMDYLFSLAENQEMIDGFNEERAYWNEILQADTLHGIATVHRDISQVVLWMQRHPS